MHLIFDAVSCFVLILPLLIDFSDGLNIFGCKFKNNNYAYNNSSLYGDMIQPMMIEAEDFDNLLELVTTFNGIVMAEYPYNDLEELIQFYKKEYKSHIIKKMNWRRYNKLLESNKAVYRPKTVSYTKNIDLLNRLIANNSNVANHVFLGSAFTGFTNPKWSENMLHNILSTREPPNFFHKDTAALLRFSMDGRLGYIVMNPAKGIQPVVVMDDSQDQNWPVNNYVMFSATEYLHFSFPEKSNGRYIVSYYVKSIDGHQQNISLNILFVYKPICSFVKKITEMSLRSTVDRAIIKRDNSGNEVAGIIVRLSAKEQYISIFKDYDKSSKSYINIGDLPKIKNKKTLKIFEEVESILGFESGNLKKLLITVKKMLKKQVFMKYLAKGIKRYNLLVSHFAEGVEYYEDESDTDEDLKKLF